ncbi:hypothetical protein T265_00518 [Opisthorchis viverrini]|uniref:Uncharacterized protein n=1 Tax=Opisthorchis viverrini TaxID=6198 RepID=A0A075A5P9_OPIVI|nr:hypothetical protein T265_00518 [Opisthorchis viverrini]KER33627.1 hypothetical protein T265_00518 [Opisthorchis viverrini]
MEAASHRHSKRYEIENRVIGAKPCRPGLIHCQKLEGLSDLLQIGKYSRSAVAPLWCITAMPPEGGTRAGILPRCPSLNREVEMQGSGSNHGPPVSKFVL